MDCHLKPRPCVSATARAGAVTFIALQTLVGGCVGTLGPTQQRRTADAHVSPDASALVDATRTTSDARSNDAGTPAVDAFALVDARVAVDAFAAPDAYVPSMTGPCPLGPPLAEPIAGCRPTTPPSTGDAHEDCVRRINQFRCECQHLQPLVRDRDGEACADMMAQYDYEHGRMPHAGYRAGICPVAGGQNECPGWGSIPECVEGCLQQMWDEGPGDFYGPPAHGHYINMSTHSGVACGYYAAPDGEVWAVQNFVR